VCIPNGTDLIPLPGLFTLPVLDMKGTLALSRSRLLIVFTLRVERPRNGHSTPGGGEGFYCPPIFPRRFCGTPCFTSNGKRKPFHHG
jgi:hypothetical protein